MNFCLKDDKNMLISRNWWLFCPAQKYKCACFVDIMQKAGFTIQNLYYNNGCMF